LSYQSYQTAGKSGLNGITQPENSTSDWLGFAGQVNCVTDSTLNRGGFRGADHCVCTRPLITWRREKRRRRQARLPKLDLQPVDELISVREQQHGGGPGAPPLVGKAVREGAALNKSCVMMLSALLQGYVEEVFLYASKRLFRTLKGDDVVNRYPPHVFSLGKPQP